MTHSWGSEFGGESIPELGLAGYEALTVSSVFWALLSAYS
jgi:hypothetical protein